MTERRDQDLNSVNQNLKTLIDSLRQQRERWQGPRAAEAALPALAGRAPALVPAPPAERSPEEERLRSRLQELERENQRIYDESVAMADHAAQLANLYVALARLLGGVEHEGVLDALEEIVISMIGSEEFAILEREPAGPALRLVRGHGAAAGELGALTLGEGVIGGLAAAGEPFLAGAGHQDQPGLVACVPLRVGREVTGAIVIFDLLAHKPQLGPADAELLQVLSTHAANALHLTSAGPRTAAGA